jgi:hypothetical protein
MLCSYAARLPGAQVVDKLASRGALLQAKNNSGWCALHIAAQEGNLEVIQALIAHGCDIDIRDHEGLPPSPRCVQPRALIALIASACTRAHVRVRVRTPATLGVLTREEAHGGQGLR